MFHFTSANCLFFVSTLSGKGRTQSFLNRYICRLSGFLGERNRFATAPFVYSTCKMSVPDGNYSISTILFLENNVHETIVCLPCTEFLFYGTLYTVGLIPWDGKTGCLFSSRYMMVWGSCVAEVRSVFAVWWWSWESDDTGRVKHSRQSGGWVIPDVKGGQLADGSRYKPWVDSTVSAPFSRLTRISTQKERMQWCKDKDRNGSMASPVCRFCEDQMTSILLYEIDLSTLRGSKSVRSLFVTTQVLSALCSFGSQHFSALTELFSSCSLSSAPCCC